VFKFPDRLLKLRRAPENNVSSFYFHGNYNRGRCTLIPLDRASFQLQKLSFHRLTQMAMIFLHDEEEPAL
jgi:hypothetical protein